MKKLLILSSLFIFLAASSFAQIKKHKHHKQHKHHLMKHKSDEKKIKIKEK